MIAIYTLILQFTGSEFLLGLIVVIKMMSFGLFSPFAGYIADRFDRRTLMILCDFGRGFAVLGFLLVRSPEMVWLLYVLTAIQMMFAAVFEPAKQSSIPNITSGEDLIRANILSNLSWSVIFTTGMGIGGIATAFMGTDWVFIVNGLGYILSTIFIFRATIPHERSQQTLDNLRKPVQGIIDGYRYLWKTGSVFRPALAKGGMSLFLGALVYLLILISDQILLMGSIGLGLLYAARGLGTAIGPIVLRKLFPDESKWVTYMGLAMLVPGICYLWVGFSESLLLMIILVIVAHSGSGANWVAGTVLLQKRTPDQYRGRVFSSEFLFFTLAQSISVTIVSLLLEKQIITLTFAIQASATGLLLFGLFWLLTVARAESAYQKKILASE